MKKVFAIGTCRVYEPARLLQHRGFDIRECGHRVRAPNQVLQFVRHLAGEDFFVDSTVGLLSTLAHEEIQRGRAPDVLRRLDAARADFAAADMVVVEISAFREFVVGGLYVDPMISYNHPNLGAEKQLLTRGQAARLMGAIRHRVAKPILWTCHVRPTDPGAEYDVYRNDRERIAETVQQTASAFGDGFFDPNVVLEELGQRRAMQKRGRDLSHLTEAGNRALAAHYRALLWPYASE